MPRAPLVTLLLVARAAADWVEISQQHYRKPIKLHTTTQDDPDRNIYAQGVPLKIPKDSHLDVKPVIQDVMTNPRNPFLSQNVLKTPMKGSYPNHSISEHDWNQDTRRLGNLRDPTVRPTDKLTADRNIYERRKYEIGKNNRSDLVVLDRDASISGKIEKVPNIGSVKRVKIANTPVKSPSLNINKISDRNPNWSIDDHKHVSLNGNSFSDELDIETDTVKESHQDISLKPSSNFKHVFSTEIVPIIHGKVKFSENTQLTTPFHRFTSKPGTDRDIVKHRRGDTRHKQNNTPEITEAADGAKGENNISTNRRPVKHQELVNNEYLPTLTFKNDSIIKHKYEIPIKETTDNEVQDGNVNSNNKHDPKEHKEENKSSSEKSEEINSSSSEIKVNTIENILKFMKVVADNISKNTRRGANSKITYLNELKHTLLANIKERIDATWPDDDRARRRSRSAPAPASARGHVEFPSSESALMTISFLTFAVFLIKLVLQVIQTYKHKSMVLAPVVVTAAGRALAHNLRTSK